ncbi:hypothetical protein IRJ41_011334 [Triplophysa rosa]|uniref:Uncharacterized protein n=1 Tax=Triplophysa rosa TaxID=992332 RepID=A0A9W7WE95_TRIRA|nr:hypothetical protein IRJ41_011334 [Triplophysa rosa]
MSKNTLCQAIERCVWSFYSQDKNVPEGIMYMILNEHSFRLPFLLKCRLYDLHFLNTIMINNAIIHSACNGFCYNLLCLTVSWNMVIDDQSTSGKDRESLEKEREQIAVEMTKWTPDIIFVDAAMSSTYFLRRQVVIEEEPPISKEFTRLVSKDLSKSFFEGLDGHLSKLIQLFRSKRSEDIPEMTSILESLHKDATNQRMRTTALLGLPWYMRETTSKFMKICEPSDHEEDVIKDVVIGMWLWKM